MKDETKAVLMKVLEQEITNAQERLKTQLVGDVGPTSITLAASLFMPYGTGKMVQNNILLGSVTGIGTDQEKIEPFSLGQNGRPQ